MRRAVMTFLSFVLVAVALQSGPLFAQGSGPSSAPSASAAARADELSKAGMSDVKQQKWSEAEAKFAAAFSLNRSYDVAANLGQTQYRLGKYRDAAENIAFALRSWPVVGKREPRELAVKRLAELRKLVATVTIRVSMPGAMVLVDGKEIGRSPLDGEVFVEPGARVIEARLVGYEDAKQTVEAVKGGAHEVALTLVKSETNGGATSTRGGINSGSATGADKARGTETASAANDAYGASQAGDVGSAGGAHVKDRPRKEVLITGIVVSALAVGSGVAFAVVSSGKASDAEDKLTSLRQQVGDPNPCWPGQEAAGCDELRGLVEGREVFGNLALWSIVAGTAVGAGTAVYAWMASKPSSTKSSAMDKDVAVMPFATNSTAGVAIRGAW